MSQAQNNFENSTPTYIEKAWSVHHIYLDLPKDEHFAIIQKRTAQMLANGFVQEVKNLLNTFTGEEKPLKSVGYKEVQAFLNGELKDLEELENLINLSTRQLAKAQRTWFKKVPKKTYHCIKEKDKIMLELKDFVAKYE
jgi:tRNA dimethylallyltransferase